MRKALRILTLTVALAALSTPALFAQVSVGAGADFVSRYVWRGIDFGDSFSVQPYASVTSGALEIGAWANYAIAADGGSNNELDLYASYSAGPVSIGVTDYFFPAPGSEYFNEDLHIIEPFVSFSGPVDLLAAVNVTNDDANSIYLEIGKTFAVDGAEVSLFAGGTPSGSDDTPSVYGTTGPGLINLGVGVSKEISLSQSFSLPVSATYVINPYMERPYLFFGISL